MVKGGRGLLEVIHVRYVREGCRLQMYDEFCAINLFWRLLVTI